MVTYFFYLLYFLIDGNYNSIGPFLIFSAVNKVMREPAKIELQEMLLNMRILLENFLNFYSWKGTCKVLKHLSKNDLCGSQQMLVKLREKSLLHKL